MGGLENPWELSKNVNMYNAAFLVLNKTCKDFFLFEDKQVKVLVKNYLQEKVPSFHKKA